MHRLESEGAAAYECRKETRLSVTPGRLREGGHGEKEAMVVVGFTRLATSLLPSPLSCDKPAGRVANVNHLTMGCCNHSKWELVAKLQSCDRRCTWMARTSRTHHKYHSFSIVATLNGH